jgi:type I restriction enzyme S subunit
MKAVNATVTSIRKPMIENFQIPLPPLPVQQEIVRILDNFTKLTAELTAELTARRKQYEYYRDFLLTFGDDVPRLAISDLLIRTKGTNITAQKMRQLHKKNGEVRIFAGGKTYADVDFKDIQKKDINLNPSIIVKSRGIIEFEYYDKPFSHKNEFWSYYSENKNVNIKFVYYYLSKNVNYFQRIANNMQMPQISIPVTDKYKVPLPPIKEQERIVAILDRFDALCNDLTSGIPAEIEARQKQYEYYRDKLLSFKEVTA